VKRALGLVLVIITLLPMARCARTGPDRWIEVDLQSGRLHAHEGDTTALDAAVTLGTPRHPVEAGEYYVKAKERRVNGHVGPDAFTVPWLLRLDNGSTIHGRYWKKRMGHVMMHDAITLRNDDAEWLYNWAAVGTPVIVHD
jgi:lipoprotein-anchoring transpeptidase ErfK/SrfK